ncbi:MAG: hypothetical protein ABI700_26635 [Chloroflexota bacterium]
MKKLVLLIVPPLLMTTLLARGQQPDAEKICNLATPESMSVFDWTTWKTVKISDDNLLLEPLNWDASRDIWRGYAAAKPFDQPDDASKRWTLSLVLPNHDEQAITILQSKTTPDTDYVYVFATLIPATSSKGTHYGLHPCLAFAADAVVVNDWIQRAYTPH